MLNLSIEQILAFLHIDIWFLRVLRLAIGINKPKTVDKNKASSFFTATLHALYWTGIAFGKCLFNQSK